MVKEKKKMQNWLDYYQLKYERNTSQRPTTKVVAKFDHVNLFNSLTQFLLFLSKQKRIIFIYDSLFILLIFLYFFSRLVFLDVLVQRWMLLNTTHLKLRG